MQTIEIKITRSDVMNDEALRTSYIGSKMQAADSDAYRRVFAADADQQLLAKFWDEACAEASLLLDHWLTDQGAVATPQDYRVQLGMTDNWNTAYLPSVKEALKSFLVNSILTRWLMVAHRPDAEAYAALATGAARQVTQLMLVRKRPVRRPPSSQGGDSDLCGDLWNGPQLWGGPQLWKHN